jgi:hypothetical protein
LLSQLLRCVVLDRIPKVAYLCGEILIMGRPSLTQQLATVINSVSNWNFQWHFSYKIENFHKWF